MPGQANLNSDYLSMTSEESQEQQESVEPGVESLGTTFLEEEIDFEELYAESVGQFKAHQIVNGKVITIQKDFVTVDIGYKSEGQINSNEFLSESHEMTVSVGDEIEVFLEAVEDSDGIVVLSREKAEKLRIWENVGRIYEEEGMIEGVISSRIKGGLSVDIGIKAFLPGSQVDLRPVRNLDKLIGERFEFKILKFNQKRGNIVLSRRALLEVDREERRKKTLAVLEEGVLIKGYVKNITEYGVFIDLGGVDGLLHITDITWGRIVHPSEMFNIGDEVEVMVLKFDAKEEKVSLGYKQKQGNPWDLVEKSYPAGARIQGKIVSLTDYGAFIELEPGVEGLIHVSEMSWTKKVRHPAKMFSLGQIVEAIVKDLDVDRKRISLSIREAEPNPWETIHLKYPLGSLVRGKVRNITDFGIFVGLEDGIDGLVHISDLSWSQRQRKPSQFSKKGEEIEVKILHIDPEKERLSLGIKQLTEDPWRNLEEKVHVNDEVNGRVVNVTDFGIFVEVLEGVEGLIHISEVDSDIPKDKLEEFYKVGSSITAKVLKVDVDERRLGLGIAAAGGAPRETELENTVLKDALANVVVEAGFGNLIGGGKAPADEPAPPTGESAREAAAEAADTAGVKPDSTKPAPERKAEQKEAATATEPGQEKEGLKETADKEPEGEAGAAAEKPKTKAKKTAAKPAGEEKMAKADKAEAEPSKPAGAAKAETAAAESAGGEAVAGEEKEPADEKAAAAADKPDSTAKSTAKTKKSPAKSAEAAGDGGEATAVKPKSKATAKETPAKATQAKESKAAAKEEAGAEAAAEKPKSAAKAKKEPVKKEAAKPKPADKAKTAAPKAKSAAATKAKAEKEEEAAAKEEE